jgi:hypothetical protein
VRSSGQDAEEEELQLLPEVAPAGSKAPGAQRQLEAAAQGGGRAPRAALRPSP